MRVLQLNHSLTASRCRALASQIIDDAIMIKSSNTPSEDFMQMLSRTDVFGRYICESSGKHLHYFCNQIILNVKAVYLTKSTGKKDLWRYVTDTQEMSYAIVSQRVLRC